MFTKQRINLESIARQLGVTLTKARELATQKGYRRSGYKHAEKAGGYIVTAYTPGVPVHEQFLQYLQEKAKREGRQLIVVPTSPIKKSEDYVPDVVAQLVSRDKLVEGRTQIAAHLQFSPQVARPFTGMAAFTDGLSLVLASPRQVIKQIPTLVGYSNPAQVLTTGGCNDWSSWEPTSLPQHKSKHHFRLGFVVVDGNTIRQVHASKKGEFTDLSVDHEGKYSKALAVVWGDLHAAQVDQEALDWAVLLTKELGAPIIVGHDTFDGQTCNRHDVRASRRLDQFHTVSEEVDHHNKMLQEIENLTNAHFKLPFSNHTAFLDTWCNNTSPTQLHQSDLEIYHQVLTKGSQSVLYGQHIAPGGLYNIGGISCGSHGHIGNNGARGSINGFSALGHRSAHGHTHTPESFNGHEVVGCLAKKQQGYNMIGGSTWRHSIGSINKYGKFQHLIKDFS
jgi:hypothetical protein